MTETTTGGRDWLATIRALLAKAADEGATEAEAQALTERATALMAKYAIDAALLHHGQPGTGLPVNQVFAIPDPYARVSATLLYRLAEAVGCKCILLGGRGPGERVDVFGFASDIERADVLYTSLLLQMHHGASRFHGTRPGHIRAERRAWMLGFINVVQKRVEDAEARAQAEAAEPVTGVSKAVVLMDRATLVRRAFAETYPRVRNAAGSYGASAGEAGAAAGARANIGGTGVAANGRRALA